MTIIPNADAVEVHILRPDLSSKLLGLWVRSTEYNLSGQVIRDNGDKIMIRCKHRSGDHRVYSVNKTEVTITSNARFWDLVNGSWVKITLTPGQSLQFNSGGPCDEGYHYESTEYRHEGDHVVSDTDTQSRDCDGRLDRTYIGKCHITKLRSVDKSEFVQEYPSWDGIMAPEWVNDRSYQRDYTAEDAGY